mgnify:CR=1 FL=1
MQYLSYYQTSPPYNVQVSYLPGATYEPQIHPPQPVFVRSTACQPPPPALVVQDVTPWRRPWWQYFLAVLLIVVGIIIIIASAGLGGNEVVGSRIRRHYGRRRSTADVLLAKL